MFTCHNLNVPPPKLGIVPQLTNYHPFFGTFTGVNLVYGYKLLPIVMNAVTNYAAKIGIDLPKPFDTNQVRRFFVADNGGWPHSELELINGMRFLYRNTTIVEYAAPDDFFSVAWRRPCLCFICLRLSFRSTGQVGP